MTHTTFSEDLRSARLTKLGYEFTWAALGVGMATVGGAAGVRVLTGVLSPSTYGALTLAMTLSALTHQSIFGPLGQAFLRYFAPSLESGRFGAYMRGVWQMLTRATGVVTAVALLCGVILVAVGHTEWIELVLGAFALSLLFGIGACLDGMQNAARHQAVVAWHQGVTPWLRVAFAFGLAVEFGARAGNALLGYVLGSAAILASQMLLFWRKILGQQRAQSPAAINDVMSLVKQMHGYAWPFATWGILAWLQMSSDRWALQVFQSGQSVGIYAVLYQLGYVPMAMLSGVALQLIVPVIFSRSGDGTDPTRLRSAHGLNLHAVLGVVVATGLMTLVALLLHNQLFAVLVGPEYRSSSAYLPAVVLAGGLFASGQCASLVLMSGTKTRLLVLPKVVTALAGVLFNVAGAYWFGIPGVVAANVLFGLLYFVWVAVLGWKYRDVGLPSDKETERMITFQTLP